MALEKEPLPTPTPSEQRRPRIGPRRRELHRFTEGKFIRTRKDGAISPPAPSLLFSEPIIPRSNEGSRSESCPPLSGRVSSLRWPSGKSPENPPVRPLRTAAGSRIPHCLRSPLWKSGGRFYSKLCSAVRPAGILGAHGAEPGIASDSRSRDSAGGCVPGRFARGRFGAANPKLKVHQAHKRPSAVCAGFYCRRGRGAEMDRRRRGRISWRVWLIPGDCGGSSGESVPRNKKFSRSAAGGPFVDRCAFLLDPSMMENARQAAAKFLRQIEALVAKEFAEIFPASSSGNVRS